LTPSEIANHRAKAASCLEASAWSEAAEHFDALGREGELAQSELAPYLIALVNSGRAWEALALADTDWIAFDRDRKLVRRLAVAPAMREGRFDEAEGLLELLVAAYPGSADDRTALASVLMRNGRREDALAVLEEIGELRPDDPEIAAKRLFGLLQAQQYDKAASLARANADRCHQSDRLCELTLLTLGRVGDHATARAVIEGLAAATERPVRVSEVAASILLEMGDPEQALAECEVALARGGSARLNMQAARACLMLDRPDEEIEGYLDAAIASSPNDVGILEFQTHYLLRRGRFDEAVDAASRALAIAPGLPNLHALHSRALKHANRYGEAAEAMLKVLELKPSASNWKRQTAAALSQAGRTEEAEAVYGASLEERRARLLSSFEAELQSLDTRIDSVKISPTRLNWAWDVASRVAGTPAAADRSEWERRARWGVLADRLILDWLECRADSLQELTGRIEGVEHIRDTLSELLANGRGVLVAGAHIGPMFAALLAVEMTGLPMRCLASAASLPSVSYFERLISTSDQTERSIVRAIHRALSGNNVVIVALDGVVNPSSERVVLEGQAITYTSLAARLAYHFGTPTIFGAPYWANGKIRFAAQRLPAAAEGEPEAEFRLKWQETYLEQIRAFFARGPENLRLSGGLWRDIGTSLGA
jgi:tetratricopeptide (TPR) repeat protein